MLQIAAAAFPMVARFGSGGFGAGYSAKLDTDDGTYGAVKLGADAVQCHDVVHADTRCSLVSKAPRNVAHMCPAEQLHAQCIDCLAQCWVCC